MLASEQRKVDKSTSFRISGATLNQYRKENITISRRYELSSGVGYYIVSRAELTIDGATMRGVRQRTGVNGHIHTSDRNQ